MIKTMKTQDKDLLLKDLSARLPYGVKVCYKYDILMGETTEELTPSLIEKFNNFSGELYQLKPYLRSIESITDKEFNELQGLFLAYDSLYPLQRHTDIAKYIYEHHIDSDGLIPKGLALEAPNGMYNF